MEITGPTAFVPPAPKGSRAQSVPSVAMTLLGEQRRVLMVHVSPALWREIRTWLAASLMVTPALLDGTGIHAGMVGGFLAGVLVGMGVDLPRLRVEAERLAENPPDVGMPVPLSVPAQVARQIEAAAELAGVDARPLAGRLIAVAVRAMAPVKAQERLERLRATKRAHSRERGLEIRRQRKAVGWTQERLGREAGMQRSTVADAESGRRQTAETVERLMGVLAESGGARG